MRTLNVDVQMKVIRIRCLQQHSMSMLKCKEKSKYEAHVFRLYFEITVLLVFVYFLTVLLLYFVQTCVPSFQILHFLFSNLVCPSNFLCLSSCMFTLSHYY